MQDNNQIIKLFPGELGVEAFYTEREALPSRCFFAIFALLE